MDIGGSYKTHGAPFDPNFPTGASYILGGGGRGATGRHGGICLAPNAMSQSNAGIKVNEPIGRAAGRLFPKPGWRLTRIRCCLSNAPQAMQNAIGVRRRIRQASPFELEPLGLAGGDDYVWRQLGEFLAR